MAGEALTFHPEDPEGYRQIASIFAAQGRIDDAAAALIEGGLITSDFSLKSDVLSLYRSAPGKSCAITEGPNGPALNLACDRVHKPFCMAYVEAVKAAIENDRWDVARQQKDELLHTYGCPASSLKQLLPH